MSFNASLFFLLFARIFAFFVLSPLLAHYNGLKTLKMGLTILVTLVLYFPMAEILIPNSSMLPLLFFKEILIGYLMGALFAFLIESLHLAGRALGTMAGFSATALFNPMANFASSPIVQLFTLTFLALFLALDLHHLLLHILKDSFLMLPLGVFAFSSASTDALIEGSTALFHHGLEYIFVPFVVLSLLMVVFALFARLFPHVPIFFIALPLQLIVAFLVIGFSLHTFPPILEKSFDQIGTLIDKILVLKGSNLYSI